MPHALGSPHPDPCADRSREAPSWCARQLRFDTRSVKAVAAQITVASKPSFRNLHVTLGIGMPIKGVRSGACVTDFDQPPSSVCLR
jgi:hypothetical protein